jgi:hypothetical protein
LGEMYSHSKHLFYFWRSISLGSSPLSRAPQKAGEFSECGSKFRLAVIVLVYPKMWCETDFASDCKRSTDLIDIHIGLDENLPRACYIAVHTNSDCCTTVAGSPDRFY